MLLFLMGVVSISILSCEESNHFELQGHRGWRGLYPENSILGFEKAMELGVDVLEMDLVVTADMQVVVCHDWLIPSFCRINDTIQAKGDTIFKHSLEYLRNVSCGENGNLRFPLQRKIATGIPTLNEVLLHCETKNETRKFPIRYNIELKSLPEGDGLLHPIPEVFCKLVADELKRHQLEGRVVLQSFDVRILNALAKNNEGFSLSLLVDENEAVEEKMKMLQQKPEILSPYFKLVNAEVVKYCEENHMKLIPWTVNTISDAKAVLALGADGIITDYPDSLLTLK